MAMNVIANRIAYSINALDDRRCWSRHSLLRREQTFPAPAWTCPTQTWTLCLLCQFNDDEDSVDDGDGSEEDSDEDEDDNDEQDNV